MAAEDIIVIAVLLMVLGSGLFIIGFVGSTFSTEIIKQSAVQDSSTAVAVFESMEATSQRFDTLFLAAFIGLTLGLIILSWFIPTHPVFYIGYFITMILTVVVSAIMSNVWEQISQNAKLISMLVNFPITNHVLSYLPLYMAVIGFIGVTVLFGKPMMAGGEQ